MKILRPDQLRLKYGVYQSWNSGNKNVLMVQPTGGGKSVVVSDIVNEKNSLGAKQVVIAHRNELIGQMSMHIAERGVKHQIIGPKQMVAQIIANHRREFNGYSFVSPTAHCSVAGVDTLISRQNDLVQWGAQIDDWTIDEAHHVLKLNKWGRAIELFPNANGLGVTAWPGRADGFGLGRHHDGVFDDMIVGPSTRELMDIEAITDYDYIVPANDFEIDDSAVAPSGDFSTQRMREASKKSHIVGDVVKEYCTRTYGKRAIIFATDVETSGEIAEKFKALGIPAASISAQTPSATRDELVRRFKVGQIWVLVNVDLFGEGFDVPAVEVVFMCRPTASLSVYLQQAGRALRTMPGKIRGLIVDMVSNYKRLKMLPDSPRYPTLDRREKRAGKKEPDPELVDLTPCKNCSRPYLKCLPACPHCGAVPEIAAGGRGAIEQIDGDLILLDRAKLAALYEAAQLETPAAIKVRIFEQTRGNHAAAAGIFERQKERWEAQQRLDNAIANWAGWQRAIGRDDQQSYRRFYLTLGIDVLSARALPRADMDKMATTIEGWMPR